MVTPPAENNFGFTPAVRETQHAAELDRSRYPIAADTDDETLRSAYAGLVLLERRFSPNLSMEGYADGSATTPDEMLVSRGDSTVLVTAERATDQLRVKADGKRQPRQADYGTGALSVTTVARISAQLLVSIGRQTRNANYDSEHPLKLVMRDFMMSQQPIRAHLSIHGMGFSRVQAASDELPFGAILGIGEANKASEATRHLAARIVEIGHELGLRIGANAPMARFQAGGYVVRQTTSGSPPVVVPETIAFAAYHPGTSRAYAQ